MHYFPGYVVLVEGVQTGTATLVAKLSESFFEVVGMILCCFQLVNRDERLWI